MTNQDKVSITITFLVGVLAGGYLYLFGFATIYHLPEAGTKDVYEDLVITADSYGACELDTTCLSFQFLQDGSYRAIVGETTHQGNVPRRVRNILQTNLQPEFLQAESALVNDREKCHYGEEGTNFKFVVTRNGVNYEFDTCRTAINYDGVVWLALTDLWKSIVADLK